MNREARLSLASKGLLGAAVVTLIMGAKQPMDEPLSQQQPDAAERIQLYDAQPNEITLTGRAPQSLDLHQARSEQRWFF